MTDKEKLEKLKKLADAMYYAAQYLTTDASRLHKAMDEYHKFIIHECKEEHISEDLVSVAEEYAKKHSVLLGFDCDSEPIETGVDIKKAVIYGANWQKQQDQSIIELAEDHAMLSGMNIMEQQMMAKAIDAELYSDGMFVPLIGLKDKEKVSDIKFGDKVKVIILKDK